MELKRILRDDRSATECFKGFQIHSMDVIGISRGFRSYLGEFREVSRPSRAFRQEVSRVLKEFQGVPGMLQDVSEGFRNFRSVKDDSEGFEGFQKDSKGF